MSKSKGTFVMAATYLKHLDPAFLRYYFASKLGPRLEDLDLNPDEFVDKVNSDLVGKVVNLASRTAKFVQSSPHAPREVPGSRSESGGDLAHGVCYYLGRPFKPIRRRRLIRTGCDSRRDIAAAYEACDYSRAMRLIMELADRANPYIDAEEAVGAGQAAGERASCKTSAVGLNLFRQIVVYLAPVLPKLAEQAGALLNDPIKSWDQSQQPLVGTHVAAFSHMMKRVERKDIDAMIEESKQGQEPGAGGQESGTGSQESGVGSRDTDAALQAEPLLTDLISIDEFSKVDLRVARVLTAEEVPGAKKLLKLTLSLGGDVQRQVIAGIKAAYKPEQLIGRLVVMVANLQPRQMKFGLSEGMVTAVGPGETNVFLLALDEGAQRNAALNAIPESRF
jgi:methionyl-tRNA synthetase